MIDERVRLQELVAQVAAAYLSNAQVTPAEIPFVIGQIWNSLTAGPGAAVLAPHHDGPALDPEQPPLPTPGQIRRSITPDALISFEDNQPYKTLKRHLASRGLTPETYRAKWRLPADYPMVAANYSAVRAETARRTQLGLLGQQARAARDASKAAGAGRKKRAKPSREA